MYLIGLSWIPICIIPIKRLCLKSWFLAWNTLLWIYLKFTLSFYKFPLIPLSCTWQFISQSVRKIFSKVVKRNKYVVTGQLNIFLYKKNILNSMRRKCLSDVHDLKLIILLSHLLTHSISYCLLISHFWSNEVYEKYLKMVIYYNILILLFVIGLVLGCEMLLLETVEFDFFVWRYYWYPSSPNMFLMPTLITK